MNVHDLANDPEWLEDDSRAAIPNRSRIRIDPRDQQQFGLGDSEWICHHCGAFLEDQWDVCGCRD